MSLSPTEERVLCLRYQAYCYKEISAKMGLSLNTIKTHCRRAVQKTHARSIGHAVFIWRENQSRQLQLAV